MIRLKFNNPRSIVEPTPVQVKIGTTQINDAIAKLERAIAGAQRIATDQRLSPVRRSAATVFIDAGREILAKAQIERIKLQSPLT